MPCAARFVFDSADKHPLATLRGTHTGEGGGRTEEEWVRAGR